jgi:hypothetical protein
LYNPNYITSFANQSTFNAAKTMKNDLESIQGIKELMERSSRFISLSSWSGIAAGCCALIGAGFAYPIVSGRGRAVFYTTAEVRALLLIAGLTFICAFIVAAYFTYIRSRREKASIWNSASKRLMWSILVPIVAGAVFLLRMINLEEFGVVAPGSLIFYGIALFCGSKQTLSDIKYLGYAEIILGFISLWMMGYGFYFWTIGFGFFNIAYGIWMWYKYERK